MYRVTAFFWYTFYTTLREKNAIFSTFFPKFQKLSLMTEFMSPGCEVQPNKDYHPINQSKCNIESDLTNQNAAHFRLRTQNK